MPATADDIDVGVAEGSDKSANAEDVELEVMEGVAFTVIVSDNGVHL